MSTPPQSPPPAPPPPLYFDANATLPPSPQSRAAFREAEENAWANPSTPTAAGVRAKILITDCRHSIADRMRPATPSVIFTGGATETNNAVIAHEAKRAHGGHGIIAVSDLEHPSVLEPARAYADANGEHRLRRIPANPDGTANLGALEEILAAGGVTLVSLMTVSNETGAIQPVQAARELAAAAGARFHTDASQAFGKIAPAVLAKILAGVDYVTGCAHKFAGPKGVGFLAIGREALGDPFGCQLGGAQESGLRAGTENTPAIAAMRAALDATDAPLTGGDATGDATGALAAGRDAFEREVLRLVPGTRVNGAAAPRVWNTSSLTLPRFDGLRWVKRLERLGFIIGTGSACAALERPYMNARTSGLASMGVSNDEAKRTVRVSGWLTQTPDDWLALADAFGRVWRDLSAEGGSTVVRSTGTAISTPRFCAVRRQ
ncbi:MAG: aminotransferase class V-fold PLP-dependent enzyme [Puniceicoccales bacterium]|jgi:cysteine desulfurase|nr:aminotransferase class V-fold PLP-dependent enzyme [Puniceicoccales bacterium]